MGVLDVRDTTLNIDLELRKKIYVYLDNSGFFLEMMKVMVTPDKGFDFMKVTDSFRPR